jgi:hypothetical protein
MKSLGYPRLFNFVFSILKSLMDNFRKVIKGFFMPQLSHYNCKILIQDEYQLMF